MGSDLVAGLGGGFVALVLALATGRTHGWSLVAVVVIGVLAGGAVAEAWHRGPLDRG